MEQLARRREVRWRKGAAPSHDVALSRDEGTAQASRVAGKPRDSSAVCWRGSRDEPGRVAPSE